MEATSVQPPAAPLIVQLEQERQKAMALAKTLAQERDIFQAMMENTRALLAYLDPQFNFLRVNPEYVLASRHTIDELIGHNHFDLFPDDENRLIFEKARDTGQPIEFRAKPFIYQNQPERGITYWDWSLIPVKDKAGRVEGLVLSLVDVTERIRAEQASLKTQEELETRVEERTRDLVKANEVLQTEIIERKRVAEQLRLQTTAVEAAANGIIITDRQGRIQWCNQAFLRMTGYQIDEVLGQNPRFLRSGKHTEHFFKHLWETILSGQVWVGETINRRKDDSLYTEEQTITPVKNESGEITHFIAIKQDISERKLFEDLIQQNAERSETLAEISSALVEASLDSQVILNIVSTKIATTIGDACVIRLLSEDGRFLNPVAYHHPDTEVLPFLGGTLAYNPHPVSVGHTGRAFQTGLPVLIPKITPEEINLFTSPEYIPYIEQFGICSLLIVPISLHGEVIGTLHLSRDSGGRPYDFNDQILLQSLADRVALAIANARQLEEIRRLYNSELSQRQLAEALAQAAAALNSSLKLDEVLDLILDQTLRVVPCYGVNIMFLDGDCVRLTIYRGYQDHFKSVAKIQLEKIPLTPSLQRMISTGELVYVADTTQDPNWIALPNIEWLRSYVGVPLRSGDQIIGFLNVDSDQPDFFSSSAIHHLEAISTYAALAIQNARTYQDLETYLKQEQAMRSQLIQAEKFSAMGRMVASVTHELNNPLQTIKNCLFLVKQEISQGDTMEEYLEIATNEIQRISNLVMQLREIYRPKTESQMVPVELGKLIEEIKSLIQPHLQRHHVVWRRAPMASKLFVHANPDQLKQVFLNICINAIDAMQPTGGTLTVSNHLDLEKKRVGVAFKDNGPGITAENKARLFDPFFTTKENGTGLGLSISFEIIQRHAGQIEVESQPGKGSNFTVWLPITQAET